jgi:hypothetical protein
MARKKPITNTEALKKLKKAGLISEYKTNKLAYTQANEFSTVFKENKYRRFDHNKNYVDVNASVYSYMIPVHIWKEHVVPRFGNKFKVGDMVRVTQESKRYWERSKWSQDTGDSQDFRHLGIGSGKTYISEDMQDAIQSSTYYRYGYARYGNYNEPYRIKIGNNKFPANTMSAVARSKFLASKGVMGEQRFSWKPLEPIPPSDLIEYIPILGHGLLGSKRMVNGWVWEVYVHFLYPTWDGKRETRYMIKFENGAYGYWTDDYMHRVYDIDIDYGQRNLMVGCTHPTCRVCGHGNVHLETPLCERGTCSKGCICKSVFNYDNLWNFTHGTALEAEKEEDKES